MTFILAGLKCRRRKRSSGHLCKDLGDLIEGVENPTVAGFLDVVDTLCSYLPGLRSLSGINGGVYMKLERPRSERIIRSNSTEELIATGLPFTDLSNASFSRQ